MCSSVYGRQAAAREDGLRSPLGLVVTVSSASM